MKVLLIFFYLFLDIKSVTFIQFLERSFIIQLKNH